jgi:PAS domain-containing protein
MAHTNQIHQLTLRTATALARLAELERRGATGDESSSVTRAALQQLSTALEELQVANEQLEIHLSELAAMRTASADVQRARDELANALPIPVLWTDSAGTIATPNETAARFLNVPAEQLPGESLPGFVVDNPILLDALHRLLVTREVHAVDLEVAIAPRERGPRIARMHGRRLDDYGRLCVWFIEDGAGDSANRGTARQEKT